jgi:hypothetical protein
MKNISILTAFAVCAVGAMISSVTVFAAVKPAVAVQSVDSSVVMPVTQELPFDRYWSKN